MKISTFLILFFIPFLINGKTIELTDNSRISFDNKSIITQQKNYEENLNLVAELYLSKSNIPEKLLLQIIPKSHNEFEIYYGTTNPENELSETAFFIEITNMIFEKVTVDKNEKFYLPSLQFASFADGEFYETFVFYLEMIIKIDRKKFCDSVKGKEYFERNPIKYYYEENNCE